MSPPEINLTPSHEDATPSNTGEVAHAQDNKEFSSETAPGVSGIAEASEGTVPTSGSHNVTTSKEGRRPEGSSEQVLEEDDTKDLGNNLLETVKPAGITETKEPGGQNTEHVEGSTAAHFAAGLNPKHEEHHAPYGEHPREPASASHEAPKTSQPPPLSEASPPEPPEKPLVSTPSPPPPPPKDDKYLGQISDASDGQPSSSTQSKDEGTAQDGEEEFNEKYEASGNEGGVVFDDSRSEIQSIMEQFDDGMPAPRMEEIMSPRLEIAGPMLGSPVSHPPRKSSLEPLQAGVLANFSSSSQAIQSPPPRTSSLPTHPEPQNEKGSTIDQPHSPGSPSSIFKPQPPQPDPEPDLPFDFHRFLEQLRHRTADPVAKFLRSFLQEFGKKQWMVHEQVKIISDFLEFITKKMAQCEVWRTVSEQEFDNAREGMEKLVMNRLYTQTFSPAIPPPEPEPPSKGRRRGPQSPAKPGRRGQHQEDVERDEVLAQKVRIYKWVREEHLDIKPAGEKGRKFLQLAQQELLKIKSYRAPRDKVICVLNCCKVIFGFLKSAQKDQSADAFVPLLIYVVLQANPEHLVSNVQYILRFRNQEKLNGEAGYYVSSLMGAIQFIENLDRTSLTITDEEFEKNVEAAVSAIAERPDSSLSDPSNSLPPPTAQSVAQPGRTSQSHRRLPSPHGLPISEKSALSRPEVTPRNSLDAERAGPPRRSTSLRNINGSTSSAGGSFEAESSNDDNDAVKGLLRTIQRPLSTIGRMFSDSDSSPSQPALTPQPGNTPRLSPAPPGGLQRRSSEDGRRSEEHLRPGSSTGLSSATTGGSSRDLQAVQRMSAEDAAARQASAEAEEARRIQQREHKVVVDTLAGMFPNLDREVIDDVVRLKDGRVGLAVDACLALTNP